MKVKELVEYIADTPITIVSGMKTRKGYHTGDSAGMLDLLKEFGDEDVWCIYLEDYSIVIEV